MRVFHLVVLCLGLSAWSTPARAETASSSFDELKKETKATRVESASQLRTNLEAYDGSTVELQGEVAGLMTREGAKTVMLKVGDDMAILYAPAELKAPLLRAGVTVRVLARVNAGSKDAPLTILATTAAPTLQPIVATVDDSPEIAVPMTGEIPLPQSRTQPKPQPKPLAARGGSTPASRASTKPSPAPPVSGSFDLEEMVQDQKPAYEALVRRHNSKLKPEVVEEIAEALLRAGYGNNMDPRFLAAIIAVESSFDVNCVSSSGAMGLGQVMPFNLKEAGIKNPWSPTENVFGTARLLRGHLNDYKNRSNGTLLAVAAYNAGPGAVRRAGYKVPSGAQVQRYVWKVYYRYKAFAPDMF